MNAVEVIQRLERLHPAEFGEWSFHREVFRIDAYAVRLFRGGDAPHYRRVAYEVKVARSDFLSELRSPEKRAGGLELSNYFYLAMPADLAAACLAEAALHMPECGVLAVHAEPQGFERTSPFLSAGSSAHVRTLRKAPIRACRGWSPDEWSNLMRRQHAPTVSEVELRHELEMRHEAWKHERRASRVDRRAREQAQLALARLAGHTVEVGQTWRGPWKAGLWTTGEKAFVSARVEVVYQATEWGSQGSVRLRRLGPGGEPLFGLGANQERGFDLGVFLSLWRRGDDEPWAPPEWEEDDAEDGSGLQSVREVV